MNKQRRKQIDVAINYLEKAKDILEQVLVDEEEIFDNIPDNLKGSERAITSEEAIDIMQDVINQLEGIC